MKKVIFLIFQVLLFAVLVSSCKDEKDDSAEKFSSATVAENKGNVEDAGIELVTTMSNMKSIETVGVLVNLSDILSSIDAKKAFFSKDSKLFSTLETFTATAKGDMKVNDIFDAMAAPKDLGDDPESIKEAWDSIVGTYTWNPGLNDFDIVYGGNKVTILFPSTDVSTTNDATITVSNYTGVTIADNVLGEDYTGDFPASLNADLKIGSTVLVSFTFGASYAADGIPTAIAADLTIEKYKFEIDITNDTKAVSANYKFLENTKVIMDMGASGNGLFTKTNYDANTHTITETYEYPVDWVYNPNTGNYEPVYTDTWEETDFEEILNSASAHFQLFDVAIRGDINVKGLMDEIRKIDEKRDNETITSEEADSLSAIQINKFLNLRLVNVTNNQIMAKVQAYVRREVHTDGTYEWVESRMDFRLTFSDGSLINTDTYFNSGFEDFIAEVNKLISDLNSEYDLEIDTVEYPPED